MVLLALAAGGAASGTGMNMFRYNRDGWMTDVQVNQNRRYQKQQVRLSQAEMFREDIRDLVGASVSKQNNYVLIATLVLGMIAECFVEGPMPDGAAEFVTSAYMLCVGSSLLYLVLSVLCAVSATTLASKCQKDLLTTLVRLPVDEFVAEIDEAAKVESTEAFEHQQVERMFRLPGLARLAGGMLAPAEAHPAAKTVANQAEGARCASPSRQPRAQSLPPKPWDAAAARTDQAVVASDVQLNSIEEGEQVGRSETQADNAKRHLDVFHQKEAEWDVIARCAFVFGALGMSHLLQAYGYYAAAKYYSGSTWASWIVQFLVVLVDAIFARMYLNSHPRLGLVGAFLNVLAPTACTCAIRFQEPGWLDKVCIPMCFFCHLLWNCLGCWHLSTIVESVRRIPNQDKSFTDVTCPNEPVARQRRARKLNTDFSTNTNATRYPQRRKRLMMIFIGNSIVILAWSMTIVWSLYHATHGDGDNGRAPAQLRRLSGSSVGAREVESQMWPRGRQSISQDRPSATSAVPAVHLAEGAFLTAAVSELPVAWPHPRFRPHSVACGDERTCFVANDFLVFELDLLPAGPAVVRPVTCNITGSIIDLVTACAEGRCRPLVLVRQQTVTGLFECSSSMGEPLLTGHAVDLRRIAAGPDGGLFTLQAGRVLEHKVVVGSGWRPLWPVLEAVEDEVVALDTSSDSTSLLLFRPVGTVDVVDADSGRLCRSWAWPVQPLEAVAGAAVIGRGAAVVALQHVRDIPGGPSGHVRLLLIEFADGLGGCNSAATSAASGPAAGLSDADVASSLSGPQERRLRGRDDGGVTAS